LAQASLAAGLGLAGKLNAEAIDPSGFTLTGFPGEQTGSYYVGLGPEAAAAECVSAVQSAITAAKNPVVWAFTSRWAFDLDAGIPP
jgi:hypothetical protein